MDPFALMGIGLVMVYGTAPLRRYARRRRDRAGADRPGHGELAGPPADAPQTRIPPATTAGPDPESCRDRLLAAHRAGTVRNALIGLIGVVIASVWFTAGGESGAFLTMMIGGWVGMDAIGRVWTLDGFHGEDWRTAQATIWTATVDGDGDIDQDFDGFIGSLHLTLARDVHDPDDVTRSVKRETHPCLVRFVPRTATSPTSWNGLTVVMIASVNRQVIGDVAGRRLYNAVSTAGWHSRLCANPGNRH